jgi:pantothenate kinase type III
MATVYDTTIEINNVSYGICAIDVGNSRVKIHHDNVFLTFPYDKDWKRNVQLHMRDQVTKKYLVCVSSVNAKQTTAIVKVLQRIPGHMILNAHILLMRNEKLLHFGNVENAGIDRLLGAIGALTKVKAPCITVDCGTAVTVNAISADRTFIGGAIFAGLNTQLFGLAKETSGIPEMDFTQPESPIGTNTRDSVMAGITAAVTGGIAQSIHRFQERMFGGATVPVVITGGEGEYITAALEQEGITATYHRHMVTDGSLTMMATATAQNLTDAVMPKIQ